MNIGLDILGGDFAPSKVVEGLHLFVQANNLEAANIHITCFGDKAIIENDAVLANHPNIHVVHAPTVIGMHEHPTKAFKEKQDSSIVTGFYALKQQKIDAFISAGNTGCMLVGSMLFLKTLPGVLRPAIPTLLPKLNNTIGILLDVGLNADCKPEHLQQFGHLGTVYAKKMFGINEPKLALLNIGEEEGKGNLLAQAAYPLLKERQSNFIGNAEGRDVLTGQADVLVCDGFVGNIVLKMAESFYGISQKLKIEHDYFKRFNYEQYGGVPVLGVEKPVIIGHGISGQEAFKNMIRVAVEMCEQGLDDYAIPHA
jgi:phosphate acyltransferase